jgi:hypothetical protein
MNFKISLKKKQLELTLTNFIILNFGFFFMQINDYIKTSLSVNILFNISLTKLLFMKNNLFNEISNVSKKSYNISLKSFSSSVLPYNITQNFIYFKPFLDSLMFKIDNNYYQYNLDFFYLFKPIYIIFNLNLISKSI